MAGKVNPTTEQPKLVVVTFALLSGGIDTRIDNPHDMPEPILAAALRSLADELDGRHDRTAGLY